MDVARVALEVRGCWLWVWTPENHRAFERDLERRVPEERRIWDASAGAWRVHVAFTDFVLALAQKHFPEAWALDDTAEERAALAAAYDELHLIPTAPDELIDGACRALMSIYRAEGAAGAACIERVNAACAVIRRHRERRDREAIRMLASTPWPDEN